MSEEEEEPTLEELLEQLKNKNKDIVLEAIDSLGKMGDPRVIIPLLELKYPSMKENWDLDDTIGAALINLVHKEACIDELLKGLESKVEGVREDILQLFVEEYGFRDIRGIIPLTLAVFEGDEKLSGEARDTLYTSYEAEFGIDKLTEMLSEFEKKDEESRKAVERFRKIRVKNLVEEISREYRTWRNEHPDSRGELSTWNYVYKLGRYKAHEELINLIYNSDEETASYALGELHGLSEKDSDSSVREACKKALMEYEEYQKKLYS